MSPWRVLTPRGRMVALLGLAVTIAAALLRERDLAWFGLALVTLAVVAVVLTRLAQPKVKVTRWVTPAVAPLGSELVGEVDLDRQGRELGRAVMLFEDDVPPVLGARPRFAMHHREGHGHREFTYQLRGRQRGRHRVGPLLADLRDPLGLARTVRAHDLVTEVLVTPVVHPLAPLRSLTGVGDVGEATPHKIGVHGTDDVLVREYRAGDDTRRIHWKSTARAGEIMVRREEQAWDPTAVVMVDTRRARCVGSGPTASVEWLVSAGLSVALHLLAAGFRVELMDADGRSVSSDSMPGEAVATRALTEHAALMPTVGSGGLDAMVRAARQGRQGQLVVALVATPSPDDVRLLAGTRGQLGRGLAIILDAHTLERASATGTQTCRDAAAWLQQAGWSTSIADATTTIPAAWTALDAGGRR